MRKSLAVLSVVVMVATLGCGKKPETSADQTANPSTPPTEQTSQAQPAPAPIPAPVPAPQPPEPIVVPAGTAITVRISQALGSKTSETGSGFTGTVASPISAAGGKMAIPASSVAQGTVVAAQSKGKMKGEGVLQLRLTQLTVQVRSYPLQTSVWSQTEKGKGKRTAATTGGGAAAGALIGEWRAVAKVRPSVQA